MPPKRYFEELADGETFKPGTISDRLRNAIGLHDDKIPIWVYRMRVLGYPPGWLKIADMSKTVIAMHDGTDEEEAKVETPLEATYNVESLVVYPGFNAPLPEGANDDYKMLRMPSMQQHQQLDFATATMKRPKPVPYKRFKLTSPEKSQDESVEATDEVLSTDSSSKLPEEEIQTTVPEKKETVRKSKLLSVGSPVPDSYITSKPPLEKWSENNTLADLIYFENLPNYTGVFDNMRSVLRNVRDRLFNKPSQSTLSTSEETNETNNNTETSDQTTPASSQQDSLDDSDFQILN